ncbi:MAG TPA: carboxypeptidase-like regulatory domain-containing protein [Planctomycetota bacterium]|nr:carboxypeptidase-like regulatory domain-containing protein [Planctomycetota bacterium]
MDAKLPGHAETSWRWGELPPGEVVDLREIALVRTGSIAGRVVNRDGKPAGGRWHVYADTAYRQPGEGGEITRVRGPADPVTGEFRLEDLPPGPAKLKADSRIANWIDGPTVNVEIGKEARADIVYEGPDNSRRITVVPFTGRFHIFANDVGSITLLGSPRGPLVARKIERSSQSWSFDDLDPGSYTIEIRDPRFKPWVREGVFPGSSVDARLEGSAACSITVVDGGGAPVHDYRLKIRYRFSDRSVSPDEFELRGRGQPEPEGGVYPGIVPGDCTLVVEVPGHAVAEAPIDHLKPDETRVVSVRLDAGATVAGFVFQSDGRTPVGKVKVRLCPREAPPSEASRVVDHDSESGPETKTDASGRFEFPNVSGGRYRVLAELSPLVAAERVVGVEASRSPGPIRILLPDFGHLRGKVLGPPGARFDGLQMSARPDEDHPDEPFYWLEHEPPVAEVAADGSFRVGPLPAGRVRVSARLGQVFLPTGFDSSTGTEGATLELARVEVREGPDTEAEFDLRERFPGSLLVTATVDGRPAPGLVVELASDLGETGGQLGADGTARLGPLFAGEWIPWVRPIEGGWLVSSAPVRVPPAGEESVRIEVKLVEGTLLVLDAESGKPLANRNVLMLFTRELERGRTVTWPNKARTDGEGIVTFRLPPGTQSLADGGDGRGFFLPGAGSVEVPWPPASGPPLEVRIRKAKPIELPGR